MTTFFISDTHFSHANILKFEPYYRPFTSIEEHDEELIKRWNNVVNKNDVVYHLGDVVFGKDNMYKLGFLNGDKRLIMGNHDCYSTKEYLKYFTKLYGCLQWQGFVILSHIPVNIGQFISGRFKYNIHGHLHSKKVKRVDELDDSRYINVSVEQLNLTPISWEELQKNYMYSE